MVSFYDTPEGIIIGFLIVAVILYLVWYYLIYNYGSTSSWLNWPTKLFGATCNCPTGTCTGNCTLSPSCSSCGVSPMKNKESMTIFDVPCTLSQRADKYQSDTVGKYRDLFGPLTQTGQARMKQFAGQLDNNSPGVYSTWESASNKPLFNYGRNQNPAAKNHNGRPLFETMKGGKKPVSRADKYRTPKKNPEMMRKKELLEGSIEPQEDDEVAATDWQHTIAVQNVNPEILKNHRAFVADRQVYARQPAQPDDSIEFTYIQPWGFGRKSLPRIREDARQIPGISAQDYAMPWRNSFG